MLSNRLVFAALALACVTAAGAGGYLATRQANQASTAAAAAAEPVTPLAAVHEAAPNVAASPAAGAASPAAAPAATPLVAPPEAPARTTPAPAEESRRENPRPRPSGTAAGSVTSRRVAGAASATATPLPAQSAATPGVDKPVDMPRTVPPAQATAEPAPAAPAWADNAVPPADTRPAGHDAPPATDAVAAPPANQVGFDEVVLAADSVIGFELERAISSERARVEDRIEGRVSRDVRVGRRVAIPAGTQAIGSVMVVERGGRFKERARLGIRIHTLVLADGTHLPVQTDTIFRYGDSPGDGSAKKIGGGAVAGAILGAIIGGAKGAAVGATAGAGGGTAMVMSGERRAAQFPAGAEVTARIQAPVTVTLER